MKNSDEYQQIQNLMLSAQMHLEVNGYFNDDHITDTIDALELGRIDAYRNALAILSHKYPYLRPQKENSK